MNKILNEDLLYTLSGLTTEEKNKLQGAQILITGCAGFLGYYIMHFLARFGNELGVKRVVALDNFKLGSPKWLKQIGNLDFVDVQTFDVASDDIASLPDADQCNYIIHMASIASPHFYRKYPIETLDANIWGLRSLLDFYKDKGIKGFLFYSSSEIYGDPDAESIPTDEEYRGFVSATGPRACYDESKRFGETMCMLFANQYNMPITVVRPFNNYGPGMKLSDQRVPADFAKNIYENSDIIMLSDGTPTRTFCYIADAVVGYLKALLYGKYDYFNIGISKPEISIRELAKIYVEKGRDVFGYAGSCKIKAAEEKEYLTHNPQRRCPNTQKAKSVLGYEAQINVAMGVERFLKYLKESARDEVIW
ncbi:NAD-dependent epimerase/dehydratase family protein [Bacilliculturomica massiliensis]|uniref:NAD-dependent epimerase/dehydratase family protein n=1 Tax=Bacilliculturomica massiliensis TaxID=1917867 RepID=UPI001031479E|nr:NAD-dependent epimerase/dehydratase family protein [Bacilliculturomica massiliensis]